MGTFIHVQLFLGFTVEVAFCIMQECSKITGHRNYVFAKKKYYFFSK